MDNDRLRGMLQDAERELRVKEDEILHLRQVVDGLRGLLSLSGPAVAMTAAATMTVGAGVTPKPISGDEGEGDLSAGAAFLKAIKESPNRAVTVADIWPEIRKYLRPGYTAPRNAVNAAARRAAEENGSAVRRLPDGRYIYTVERGVASVMQSNFDAIQQAAQAVTASDPVLGSDYGLLAAQAGLVALKET